MLVNKGTSSIIGTLILGLSISFALMIAINFSTVPQELQISRQEKLFTDTTILSLLKYNNTPVKLNEYFCTGLGHRQLNKTISKFLEITIPVKYNYIFFTSSQEKSIYTYRRQKTVCAQHIIPTVFTLNLTCKTQISIILNIWNKRKKLPEKC